MLLAMVLASSVAGPPEPVAYNYAHVAARLAEAEAFSAADMSTKAPQQFDPLNVSVVVGASVSAASGQSGSSTTPYVDVVADFPFVVGKGVDAHAPLRVQLEGKFSGSPGGNVELNDVSTFKSVSFDAGLHWPFGETDTGRYTLSASGGVTSRLDDSAAVKSPGHGELCVGSWRKDHTASFNFCPVGFSTETGDAATVGRADGRVTIKNSLRVQVNVIVPYANAPSNYYQANARHNVVAMVSVGVDLDHIFTTR